MKKIISLSLTLVLTLALMACGQKPQTTDRAGKAITLPTKVEKIVSLAASTTRVLDDLGLAGKLVAVDMYSVPNITAETASGLMIMDMMAPDLEQLIALSPDIVFVSVLSSGGGEDIFAPLREAGICIIEIPSPKTVAAVFEDVQFIADCTGKTSEGKKLVKVAKAELDEIQKIVGGATSKPLVYFEVSPAPYLYTTGAQTYLDEMISLAGGTNLFAAETDWAAVTEESVVAGAPEIIFTVVDFVENATEEILARDGWQNVPAIQNSKVFYIETRDSQEPTQHVISAIKEMAQKLHPDLF